MEGRSNAGIADYLLLTLGRVYGVGSGIGLPALSRCIYPHACGHQEWYRRRFSDEPGDDVWFQEGAVIVRGIIITLFFLLTAPVAAHMIGRAAIVLGSLFGRRPKRMNGTNTGQIDRKRIKRSAEYLGVCALGCCARQHRWLLFYEHA